MVWYIYFVKFYFYTKQVLYINNVVYSLKLYICKNFNQGYCKVCLIVGNWKLNGNKNLITNFVATLVNNLVGVTKCNVAIAPPMLYLDTVRSYLKNSRIALCAQNVDTNISGAYTGDISAKMLKDLNVQYVLIGHSERRINHQESNLYIARKFSVLKKIGLIPILCIGENKEEYDSGYTNVVCIKQIDEIINLLGIKAFKNTIIAYEPIWAIGSGIYAVPENVQKTHKFIRDYIAQYDKCLAKQILIQYGGSVTSDNVVQFLSQRDINGVLVGTASLNIDSFINIIKIAEEYENKIFDKKNCF